MGGGSMQLAAYGKQDVHLTGNPQMTFFKYVYKRYSNFAIESVEHTLDTVNSVEETYRSEAESKLDYKYYLSSDADFVYREDWVKHNYNIFLKYHTLE